MEGKDERLAAARAALSQAVGSRRKPKGGARQMGWDIDVPGDATHIGTARIRSQLSTAQRLIARKTGNLPSVDAGFDEIADGVGAPSIGDTKAKASKYGNRKCEADGIKFDSERERSRYFDLKRMQSAGIIGDLRLQVSFEIAPAVVMDGKRKRARTYVADFVYERDGKRVVEDVKGMKTPVYSLKRHLMRAVHGIEVQEM
ncbi:DUF1064 domain-containing protein [Burkholderia cenocepacia]|uniref:DUF1064 domain-containing protein n=1 Tax=Burkholderia cenocepacia TaxID=95486 RepID=UPI001FC8E720|nr:DUF1064 domain-containing protein [Burkholderia cenocepacia]